MGKEVSGLVLPIINVLAAILCSINGIVEISRGATFSLWFVTAGIWFAVTILNIFSYYKKEKAKKDVVELDKSDTN